MTDYYDSMTELLTVESPAGWDIRQRSIEDQTRIIMGPHGGSIEAGTSEIVLGIAGGVYDGNAKWSYYLFEGVRAPGENGALHVTSTNFDEPAAEVMVGKATRCVAVHGCLDTVDGQPSGSQIVWCGGKDTTRRNAIRSALLQAGFDARVAPAEIAGDSDGNICNKTATPATGGVQLELTTSLRNSFYTNNTLSGRATSRTTAHTDFCAAVRSAL